MSYRKLCSVGEVLQLAPLHPAAQAHPVLPRKPARLCEISSRNGGVTCSLSDFRTHRGCVESTKRIWTQGRVIKTLLHYFKKTRNYTHSAALSVSQLIQNKFIKSKSEEEVVHLNDMDSANFKLGFNGEIIVPTAYDDCIHE